MKQGTKDTGSVVGLVFLAFAVVVIIVAAVIGIKYATADARGAASQREKTRADGNYRIAQYDKFYNLCAAVQATEDQIGIQESDTSVPDFMKAQNVNALKSKRAQLIRQYNADARKTETQAHFLSSDLPYAIDIESETTSCAA